MGRVAGVVVVLVAGVLAVTIVLGLDRDRPRPESSEHGESAGTPATHPPDGATLWARADGLHIVQRPGVTLGIRLSDDSGEVFGRERPLTDVFDGGVVPREGTAETWSGLAIVREHRDTGTTSSLVDLTRNPDGALRPFTHRTWSDRVEVVWRVENASQWRATRDPGGTVPSSPGHLLDRDPPRGVGLRYELRGEVRAADVREDRVRSYLFGFDTLGLPTREQHSASTDPDAWIEALVDDARRS